VDQYDLRNVCTLTFLRVGSYSAFDSPAKTNPGSPPKPLPPPPAFNSLFTTPRGKNAYDYDDSSAGETPRSPEMNQDSDAPTPDVMSTRPLRSALGRVEAASAPAIAGADRASPTKERPRPEKRESWFSNLGTKVKNKISSPGRGEIVKPHHTGAIEKRRSHHNLSRRDREHHHRRRRASVSSNSEDDTDLVISKSPRKTSGAHHPQPTADPTSQTEHWLSKTYTFIERHPTVPHILSFYAQLLFNIFLLSCCAYAIYSAWSAFSSDIDKKAHEAMTEVLAEMAVCAQHWTSNRCQRETRVPAMEAVCEGWGRCMAQDPTRVGRAKVGAGTLAEVLEGFVEPISWKTVGFTFVVVFGVFAVSNFALYVTLYPTYSGEYRADSVCSGVLRKTEQMGSGFSAQQQQQQFFPPPTPQRQFSGQEFYQSMPWQNPPQGLEPAPSGGFGQIEGRGSPVRRIHF